MLTSTLKKKPKHSNYLNKRVQSCTRKLSWTSRKNFFTENCLLLCFLRPDVCIWLVLASLASPLTLQLQSSLLPSNLSLYYLIQISERAILVFGTRPPSHFSSDKAMRSCPVVRCHARSSRTNN